MICQVKSPYSITARIEQPINVYQKQLYQYLTVGIDIAFTINGLLDK